MCLFSQQTCPGLVQTVKKQTHRSGHGRRQRARVHVGVAAHVAHHDVARVARVRVAFTVQVWMFHCEEEQQTQAASQ